MSRIINVIGRKLARVGTAIDGDSGHFDKCCKEEMQKIGRERVVF